MRGHQVQKQEIAVAQ